MEKPPANPKMSDVARRSGVSLTTVGRVLHQNGYVSQENRRKVEEAVRELGYIPNSMARSLKNSSSRMIGHILKFSPNLLFEQISRAVDQAAARRGYSVLSYTKYGSPGEDERIVTEFISRRVDGVIVTSLQDFPAELAEKLRRAGIPPVFIERAPSGSDRVLVDDLLGTYQAVSSIARAGHTQIAFLGMEGLHHVERLRLEGCRRALRDAGLPPAPALERMVPSYTAPCGFQAMEALWTEPRRPTAVFATADSLACGALQYLYQAGVQVPGDVSLMGYDNTLSTLTAPPISSVGIHAQEMGEKAVDLLLRRRKDPEGPPEEHLVGTELVDRGTVRRLLP